MFKNRVLAITSLLAIISTASARATPFTLPATTSDQNRIDLGAFLSGSQLVVTCSGQVSLLSAPDWFTFPDGSLAANVLDPLYQYANPDAMNYPTFAGGDGVNHYAGGGANVDAAGNVFGFAGSPSTDTTDFDTIRLGAVVATFANNPTRSSWFAIEHGSSFIVPGGEAAHLYIAVNDSFSSNNGGAYQCEINPVPEPAALALLSAALIAAGRRRR